MANTIPGTTNQAAIGKVVILQGQVQAAAMDGTVRALSPNSVVYANDQIITGSDGNLSLFIIGNPPTQLDIGRMSNVTLDEDVYAPVSEIPSTDTAAEVASLQEALLRGEDITQMEATAAGPGAGGALGGAHPTVNFGLTANEVTPESGAETIGLQYSTIETIQGDAAGIPAPIPTIGIVPEYPPQEGDGPRPYTITAEGIQFTMYEKYLNNDDRTGKGVGTEADQGPVSMEVFFRITSENGLASVTIGGETYNYDSVNGVLNGPATVGGTVGHLSGAWIQDMGGGVYMLGFTYNLTDRFGHDPEQGPNMEDGIDQFSVQATNLNGVTSNTSSISVDLEDDVPFIEVVSGFDGPDNSGAHWSSPSDEDDNVPDLVTGARENHSGTISLTGGADGLAEFSVSFGDETLVVDLGSGEPQSIDGVYGTLTISVTDGVVRYEYNADLNAEKGNTEGGTDVFTFTVTDGDGDIASDTLTVNVNGFVDFGFGDGFTVDESYLWVKDGEGNTLIKGTMAEADDAAAKLSESGSFELTAGQLQEFSITGTNGAPVDINAEGNYTVYSEHGHLDVTVSYNSGSGNFDVSYEFTLTQNYDQHEDNATNPNASGLSDGDEYNHHGQPDWDGTKPNDWNESSGPLDSDTFIFTVGSQSENLSVTILDDGLAAGEIEPQSLEVETIAANYNIVLCVDTSASMLLTMDNITGTGSYANNAANLNAGQYGINYDDTRIYAVQVAMLQMLEEYGSKPGAENFTVTLATFNTGANLLGDNMTISEAIDAISKMLPGFIVQSDGSWEYNPAVNPYVAGNWPAAGTNYNAGLTEIMGSLIGEPDYETRVYFFSDGHGNPALTGAQATAWENAVSDAANQGHFSLHTVGLINATGSSLAAVTGSVGTVHYIPPSTDLGDFVNELLGTLADLTGYFALPESADGVVTQGGLDGETQLKAFVQNVVLENGETVNAVYSNDSGDLVSVDPATGFPGAVASQYVSITTDLGTFNFWVDGKYTFTAGPNATKLIGDQEFNFTITFMDADGDTVIREFFFEIKGAPIDTPTIDLTYEAEALIVTEAALADGSGKTDGYTDSASGGINVTMDARLNLDTVIFSYTDLSGTEQSKTVSAAGDKFSIYSKEGVELGEIEITGFNSVTGQVAYTFTLTGVLDNPKSGTDGTDTSYTVEDLLGELGLSVECTFTGVLTGETVTFTDDNGDVVTVGANLTVTVLDDTPDAALTATAGADAYDGDTLVVYEGSTLEGNWTFEFGADNAGKSADDLWVEVAGVDGQHQFDVLIDVAGGTLTVGKDGTWQYVARDNDKYVQDPEAVSFSIHGTDSDGDPASASIGFEVRDYVYEGDTAAVTITTSDVFEADGGKVVFEVQLTIPPDLNYTGNTIVHVKIGNDIYDVNVDATGYGTLEVPHGNDEDVYVDPSTVTATVVGVTGGNYEAVTTGQTTTANVKDTEDTTRADISLSTVNGELVATVTLSNADSLDVFPGIGESVTVNFTINGVDHYVVISGEDVSGSKEITGLLNSIYDANITVNAAVTGFEHPSKEYEDQAFGTASGSFSPVPVVTTLTITPVNTVEGTDFVYFNIELSNAPKGGSGTVTVQVEGFADPFVVTIGADGKGVLEVPNLNDEDVYVDASTVTAEVIAVDCGYSNVATGQKATANVDDTIDTTLADISLSTVNGEVVATITLSNEDGLDVSPGDGSVTVYFTVNDEGYSVVISGANTSGTLEIPGLLDSIYNDNIPVNAEVTSFAHSSKTYEKQAFGDDSGSFPPVPVETTLTITPVNTVEGTDFVYFNIELSNAPKGGSGTVTVQVEGFADPFVVTIGADGKGVLEVPNLNDEDVYVDPSTVTAEVTAVDCGYSNVAIGQTATANVDDTIDTTTVSLDVVYNADGSVTITATVGADVQARDLEIELSNGKTITISEGNTEGFVTVSAAEAAAGAVNYEYSVSVENVIGYEDGGLGKQADDFEKLDWSGASGSVDVNRPPVAEDDTFIAPIGSMVIPLDILNGSGSDGKADYDPDGYITKVTIEGKEFTVAYDGSAYTFDPTTETVTLDDGVLSVVNNQLVFTPDNASFDAVTFDYTITDNGGLTGSATVTIGIDQFKMGTPGGDDYTQASSSSNVHLVGGMGNDILVGDPGGASLQEGSTSARNLNVAIIVDRSSSMAESGMASARAAVKTVFQELLKYDQLNDDASIAFTIVGFGSNAVRVPEGTALSQVSNVYKLNSGIELNVNTAITEQQFFSTTGEPLTGRPSSGNYYRVDANGDLRYGSGTNPSIVNTNTYNITDDVVTLSNDLINWINTGLVYGSSEYTNYEAALDSARNWFDGDSVIPGAVNLTFFVSDGVPTRSYVDQFRTGNNAASYVYFNVPQNYEYGDVVIYASNGTILSINGVSTGASGTAAYRINASGVFQTSSGGSVSNVTGIIYAENGSQLATQSGTNIYRNASNTNNSDDVTRAESLEALHDLQKLFATMGISPDDVIIKTLFIGTNNSAGHQFLSQFDSDYTGPGWLGVNASTTSTLTAELLKLFTETMEAINKTTAAGPDLVYGGGGNDLLFGDALNADFMLDHDWQTAHGWTPSPEAISILLAGGSLDIIKAYLADTKPGYTNADLYNFVYAHHEELGKSDTVLIDPEDPDSATRGGDDVLVGGTGDDIIYGQGGNDLIFGGEVHLDGIDVDGKSDSTNAAEAAALIDKLKVEAGGADNLADYLKANPGVLGRGDENDGKNILDGGTGNDILIGGGGDDRLIGGEGDNVLFGGGGADTFVISNDSNNWILDYNSEDNDILDLSGVTGYDKLVFEDDGNGKLKLTMKDNSDNEKASVTFSNIDYTGSGFTCDAAGVADFLSGLDIDIKIEY